jgi:ATP-dependent DNA helicase RecQ
MDFKKHLQDVKQSLGIPYEFKAAQVDGLQSFYEHKDTICLLPTGFGKSLIYQLTPYIAAVRAGYNVDQTKDVTIVLTPLNAIIKEQVLKLSQSGRLACYINMYGKYAETYVAPNTDDDVDQSEAELFSDDDIGVPQDFIELVVPFDDILKGKYHLIYGHPEAFLSTRSGRQILRSFYLRKWVKCVAIDEGHMIHEWYVYFNLILNVFV